jgi:hypothetical protein
VTGGRLAGWGTAVVGAVLAAAVAMVPAGAAAVGFHAAGASAASTAAVARSGLLLFLWFHHSALSFTTASGAAGLSFGVGLALMLGTLIAGLALSRAGRAVADRAGGSALNRGLHGAMVAVPYGMVCLGIAGAARSVVTVPSGAARFFVQAGAFEVRPSLLQAFLWPAVLAAVFGFLGGLRSRGAQQRPASPAAVRVRAAVAGGATMGALALALSFVGLLVLAALRPDDTRAYLHGAFAGGDARGVAVLALTLLAVPNMAAYVLFPSMGACIRVGWAAGGGPLGGFASGTAGRCVLSYTHMLGTGPRGSSGAGIAGAALPSAAGTPAAGYFLFVLAPLIAVLVGGVVAARRAGAATRRDGSVSGASAGLVFAVVAVVVALLARVSVSIGLASGGAALNGTLSLGPDLLIGPLLALAWGVIGGALGGLLAGPQLRFADGAAPPLEGGVGVHVHGDEDDRQDGDADPDPPQDDPGDRQAPPGLGPVGGVDVPLRDVAEDQRQDRTDPVDPDDPEHQ